MENLAIFGRFSPKKLVFLKKHYSEVLAQSQAVPTQRTVRIFPVSSGVICTFHPFGQVRAHHHRALQPRNHRNHSSEPREFVQRSGQKLSVIAAQDQASPLVSGKRRSACLPSSPLPWRVGGGGDHQALCTPQFTSFFHVSF